MRTIFEDEKTEAVLLVNAASAFNSINRQVFLHKICIICPPIATYVRNCYTLPSRLFIIRGTEIPPSEGITQGDPTVMSIYAIAIIPLILMIMELYQPLPIIPAKCSFMLTSSQLEVLSNIWNIGGKHFCEVGPCLDVIQKQVKHGWLLRTILWHCEYNLQRYKNQCNIKWKETPWGSYRFKIIKRRLHEWKDRSVDKKGKTSQRNGKNWTTMCIKLFYQWI